MTILLVFVLQDGRSYICYVWDDFNVNKCLTYQREGWGVYEMADTHLWLKEKAFFSGLKIYTVTL